MLTAADMLRVMQSQGAINNPPMIQTGTMTAYNSCMLGDELELAPEQLYFFRRDTLRQARTIKPPSKIMLSSGIAVGQTELTVVSDASVKDHDHTLYTKPLKEGDIVALIEVQDGRYLVLGRVLPGEEVIEEAEQTEADWSAEEDEE
jgi:hypothetical protein